MSTDFKFVPISGDISGESTLHQIEMGFNELGSEVDEIHHLAEEANSKSELAIDIAQQAADTANSALDLAQVASSDANTALDTANTALDTANTALDTANAATTDAASALASANTALSKSNQAINDSSKAVSDSSSALIQTQILDVKVEALEDQIQAAIGEYPVASENLDLDLLAAIPHKLFLTSTQLKNCPIAAPVFFDNIVTNDVYNDEIVIYQTVRNIDGNPLNTWCRTGSFDPDTNQKTWGNWEINEGPKGDKGDTGPKGATGPKGETGAPGKDGAPGTLPSIPANTLLGRGSSAGVPTALNRPQVWDILSQLDSTNYYVDAVNGNDNNDGTSAATAKKTINAVLKIVYSRITFRTANITIYLAAGDYNESILIHGTVQALNAGKYIIFRGAGHDKTWMRGISGQYAICYMADIAMDFINSYAFSRFYIQDNGTIAFVNRGGSATLNAITSASGAQFSANDTTTIIYSGDYADGVRVDIGQATLYSSIIFEDNPTFTNLYRVQAGTARLFWKDKFSGSFTGRKFLIEAGAEMRLTNGDRFRNWNDIIPGTIDGVIYPYYVKDGWKRSTYDNTPLGMISEFPFRPSELPFGWYFPSGDYFPLTSNIGKQLNSLSTGFKSDWGITLDGKGNIRLCDPARFFATDGAGNTVGRFPRFVDGVNQLPGSVQNDAIRNIYGATSFFSDSNGTDGALQTYDPGGTAALGGVSLIAVRKSMNFNAARIVPTADENRPFSVGMTPAIYLGV